MMGGGGSGFAPPTSDAAGLPFSGIPPEYRERIEKLMADEEDLPIRVVPFSHSAKAEGPAGERRFSLMSFLQPHSGRLLVALVLVFFESFFAQLGPRLTGYAIDHGIVPRDTGVLFAVVGFYFASIILQAGTTALRVGWTGRLGQQLMLGLRVHVFTHLQRLSLDFYTREKAGRVLTRMTSDIDALQNLFQEGFVNLAAQGLTLAVMIGLMLTMSTTLTGVLVLGVAPVMVVATLWFRRASDSAYGIVRERIADLMADLQESLSGIRIVAMHNRQGFNARRHRGVAQGYKDANLGAARIAATYDSGTSAVGVAGQILMLGVGGGMVLDGELGVGSLIAFMIYVPQFFQPIQQLVQLHNTYQSGAAAVRKLQEVLDEQPSVAESPDAVELPPIEGRIELDAVDFAYETGVPVLRNVTIAVAPGETLALVGPTGGGKSTLAKLVTRFYDPQSGAVRVDGIDVREVRIASLRRQLGVVPQEAFLFAGTIGENIAFAQPGVSDEQVLEACRAVGIEELIDRLPAGLATPCHERGVALSSGERQLIALARAFLSKPRVLILDEATSNLDLKTEAMVERALDVMLGGRTAILIAHRLSTAMRADRIAVIECGTVVETGTHAELLAQGGRYAAMYATWSRQGATV